ncbi:MAG: hypothetical protein SGPRY_000663, partial [Prymnesium sp.]
MGHTIAAVGSLVSEASARGCFELSGFRVGEVRGWRRAFCQANWVNVHAGDGSPSAGDTGALAMVAASPEYVSRVALMEVSDAGLVSFYEREAGYHIQLTPYWQGEATDPRSPPSGQALLCTACVDDEEADALWRAGGAMEAHCPDSSYVAHWMRKALRPLWPAPSSGLLPSPGYLRMCAEAHHRVGLLQHFLDTTLLNDRRTTLRVYCAAHPQFRPLLALCNVEGPRGREEGWGAEEGGGGSSLSTGGKVEDRSARGAKLLVDLTAAEGAEEDVRFISDLPVRLLQHGIEHVMVVPNALGWRFHFGCVTRPIGDEHLEGALPREQDLWATARATATAALEDAGVSLVRPQLRAAGLMLFSSQAGEGQTVMRVRILEAAPNAESDQP